MMLSEYLTILQKSEDDLNDTDREILNTARWLLDTDGWAYWSQPLQPNKATNLLLDKVEPIDTTHPYDNWVYNIDVQLQAVSANQMTSWYRDNVDAASVPATQVIDIDVNDAAQTAADPNAIANPDNSVMTATTIAVQYIDIKAEDDVETEIVPVVATGELKYTDLGNNIYSVQALMSDGTAVDTNTLILAGQDRDPAETEDNNLLSGRTEAMGGSIEVETIYLATTEDDTTRITKEAYYTIKGAKSTYYVTAGSDGLLGTWDDVIKDSSKENRLGTYNINADGNQQSLGWVFVKGSDVEDMLLATEYVLDNVMFNEDRSENATGVYSSSTLEAKMKEIYNNVGGSKTAIKQNQTISMADYTGEVTALDACYVENHIDENGNHVVSPSTSCECTFRSTGGKANSTAALKTQSDITNVTFFALSMKEIADAYNTTSEDISRDYRRAKYAECGKGNWNWDNTETDFNGTKVLSAAYWLRSPGYRPNFATFVYEHGNVAMASSVYVTTIGARPACYATLA
jgi:hypothetical protein